MLQKFVAPVIILAASLWTASSYAPKFDPPTSKNPPTSKKLKGHIGSVCPFQIKN